MMSAPDKTAAIAANRARYESLRAAGQGQTARALPPPTPRDGVPIPDTAVLHREDIPAGWYWTTRLKRGEALRLVNGSGHATVTLVAWRADEPTERINPADTVKVQWTVSLSRGRIILSDMGRAMLGIMEDTAGAHDALVGGSRGGEEGAPGRNTRDNFLAAVGKLGLSRRDIPPAIAFFAPVTVGSDGRFSWDAAKRRAGDFVDLRAEMDVLVALSNCPHPLDPDPTPTAVAITRFRAPPSGADDPCRAAGPEAVRAYAASDRLALERSEA